MEEQAQGQVAGSEINQGAVRTQCDRPHSLARHSPKGNCSKWAQQDDDERSEIDGMGVEDDGECGNKETGVRLGWLAWSGERQSQKQTALVQVIRVTADYTLRGLGLGGVTVTKPACPRTLGSIGGSVVPAGQDDVRPPRPAFDAWTNRSRK
ncbi:hypothetical protein VTO42DRAFT_7038 [Malbranchea cinnamomea]